jgi:hypothetical protein
LIILVALVGYRELKYRIFYHRLGKCCTSKYTTLWHNSDAKKRKKNSNIFSMMLEEMQENISTTWRIPPEVIRENQGIADFKDSRHSMWIQTRMDPKKEWLKLRYCVVGYEGMV